MIPRRIAADGATGTPALPPIPGDTAPHPIPPAATRVHEITGDKLFNAVTALEEALSPTVRFTDDVETMRRQANEVRTARIKSVLELLKTL